jgi:uncharacterized protein YbcI
MDPRSRTLQQLIEEIVRTKIQYLKEHMGRGPEGYRTYIIDDMVIVRLLRVLTPAEYEQAQTHEGRRTIKGTRTRLIHNLRPSLERLFQHLAGAHVVSMHTDVSTKTGEGIIMFVLDRKIKELPEKPSEAV